MADIVSELGLDPITSDRDDGNYHDDATYSSYASCGVATRARDDRYATRTTDFAPAATLSIVSYYEQADVLDTYQSASRSFTGDVDPSQEKVASVDGWWDEGEYLERVKDVDNDNLEEGEIAYLRVAYIIRHHNLYLSSAVWANTSPADAQEALPILHDVATGLIDEAVTHLTLT